MLLPAERSDWWIAGAVALIFHVALMLFLLRMAGPGPQEEGARAAQGPARESYRDIPAAPDGIPADSLPLAGLRRPPGDDHPIIVTCDYELTSSTGRLLLLLGEPRGPGVLGCTPELQTAEQIPSTYLRIHYDVFGELSGVMGDSTAERLYAEVRSWDLARPRPGRQWQASVIVDLTLRAR